MAKYSIQDTTLTAIGDAIRNKTGEHTRPGTEKYMKTIPEVIVSKTPNAPGFDSSQVVQHYTAGTLIEIVNFPGASSITVDCAVEFYKIDGSEYIQIASGAYDNTNFPVNETEKFYCSELGQYNSRYLRQQFTFENTDTLTFRCVTVSGMYYLGYYAECRAFDADGKPMGEYQVEAEREVEVKNTITPAQMAEEIEGLSILKSECLEVQYNAGYRFYSNGWNSLIENYGDKITTKDITSMTYMFQQSDALNKIPFDINCSKNISTSAQYAFAYCKQLKEMPNIYDLYTDNTRNMFENCMNLRKLSDSVLTWNIRNEQTSGNFQQMFYYCYSLRQIPTALLRRLYDLRNSANYVFAYRGTAYCYTLDEIIGFPVPPVAYTSNVMRNTFDYCSRLKDVIFDTEDGTPKVVTWKSQTIDLSFNVGYTNSTIHILDYNSGITKDKRVTDDATYQALKNDPDWFTDNIAYSRYNHDSAVNTINSLPDVSSGSGNTIKFKGESGSLTDGGAINTLTEEEIAVAAAKGWTVTLV